MRPYDMRSRPHLWEIDCTHIGVAEAVQNTAESAPPPRRNNYLWSELLKRVFEIDILVCERCGGPVRVIDPDGSTEVDLLVSESDQFEPLRQRAAKVTIDGRTFFVASIDDLIAMKQRAGRPQDLLDIAQLQDIKKRLA